MARHIVATVDEIPVGQRKIVEVEGRSIGVFNVGGEFFALRNTCPHQGGPLCEGRLSGFLRANRPGDYHYSRRGEILRCPWHGWEFDVKTGESWFDPTRTRVRAYPVEVASGVDVASPSNDGSPPSLQKGPYQAETIPVSVEQQYVVLDLPG